MEAKGTGRQKYKIAGNSLGEAQTLFGFALDFRYLCFFISLSGLNRKEKM